MTEEMWETDRLKLSVYCGIEHVLKIWQLVWSGKESKKWWEVQFGSTTAEEMNQCERLSSQNYKITRSKEEI